MPYADCSATVRWTTKVVPFSGRRWRCLWAPLPVEGFVDAVLAYLLTAPRKTLGLGDLGSDDDINGVIFLSWGHPLGAALVRGPVNDSRFTL